MPSGRQRDPSERETARLDAFHMFRSLHELQGANDLRAFLARAQDMGWPEVVRVLRIVELFRAEQEDEPALPDALDRTIAMAERQGDTLLHGIALASRAGLGHSSGDAAARDAADHDLARATALVMASQAEPLEMVIGHVRCAVGYAQRELWELAQERMAAACALLPECEDDVLDHFAMANRAGVVLLLACARWEVDELHAEPPLHLAGQAAFSDAVAASGSEFHRLAHRIHRDLFAALFGDERPEATSQLRTDAERQSAEDRDDLLQRINVAEAVHAARNEEWPTVRRLLDDPPAREWVVEDPIRGVVLRLASMAAAGLGSAGAADTVRYAEFSARRRWTARVRELGSARAGLATETLELERASRLEFQAQAALLGQVFDSMSDGLLIVGPDSTVRRHNVAARQLLGRPLPSRPPGDWATYLGLTSPNGGAADTSFLGPYVGMAEHTTTELIVDNEGGRRVLAAASWPLDQQDGARIVLLADVTAHRERLAELTAFAGVVAHDLRSPLTSLRGWIELAEDGLEDGRSAEVSELLSRARTATERMREVVGDWLSFTVQREGVLAPTPLRLATLVDEVVMTYRSEGNQAPAFELSVSHEVEADRAMTRQLLANLVGNAVKYSLADGRPRVAVRSRLGTDGWVWIDVVDQGVGVPEGEETSIFDEFYRAARHAEHHEGTGLGLSLCKRIVDRHGGSILARRNSDVGSTFSFCLPVAKRIRSDRGVTPAADS